MNCHVPVLPENAPFTAEQRAYLNGFLAGLFSFTQVPASAEPGKGPATLTPLTILVGSQTGTAEKLARRAAREAGERGFAPTIQDVGTYSTSQLPTEDAVLVITSTFGDGEPPDNARSFWNWLAAEGAPRLEKTRFSVCALGDSQYPKFCQFGRDVDARLEALGARRLHARQDCDTEFERDFQQWLSAVLGALDANPSPPPAAASGTSVAPATPRADEAWSRARPFTARLKTNRRLTGADSAKDVRHFEIALGPSGPSYEPGDALGVWPTNCPDLVHALLEVLGCDGEEAVPGREGADVPLRLALLNHYEINRPPVALVERLASRSGFSPGDPGADILDLLQAHPGTRLPAGTFIASLRKLQPRLYSIASSAKAHPGEVHLTVNTVRYETRGRVRRGVASCFLADRCSPEGSLPVYVHANEAFRPPGPDTPLIMIGPGTGIAPFRSFLQDRRAAGARGRNWLFFGDQHAASDFLYREELEGFQRDGLLTRLDLAWSRDQGEKVYVQQRMLEAAAEFWAWLEAGASIHVCGDASRMAKDVDAALHQVIERGGSRTREQATEYVQQLRSAKRYARDVY